jgi:hypothetical protein
MNHGWQMFNAPKRLELDYPEMDFDFMPDLLRDLIKSTANQMQIDPVIPFTISFYIRTQSTWERMLWHFRLLVL